MDDLDHRNLGVQLKLWHLQEDAPGMVFWHPRGTAVYRVLEDYVRRKMRRAGYAEVRTPQLLPQELWSRSGHWDKFGEQMFRVDDGEQAMALKPMSCPCHVQIFNKGLRSWRELPIRYAEFGACHRNEPSGSLHGIMRTRAFEQDDAHVFCREQDVEGEVACFIALLGEAYRDLGFPDYEVALATRPAKIASTSSALGSLLDLAEDAERPGREVGARDAARVQHRPFDRQVLPRRPGKRRARAAVAGRLGCRVNGREGTARPRAGRRAPPGGGGRPGGPVPGGYRVDAAAPDPARRAMA